MRSNYMYCTEYISYKTDVMILYDAIFRLSTWLKNEAGNTLTLCSVGRQPNSKSHASFRKEINLLSFTIN
jgi:hypothetical protein